MAGKPTNGFRADRRAGKLCYLQVFMRPEVKVRLQKQAKLVGMSQSRYVESLLDFALPPEVPQK